MRLVIYIGDGLASELEEAARACRIPASAFAGQCVEVVLAQRRLCAVVPAHSGARVIGSEEDREARDRSERARRISEQAVRLGAGEVVDPPLLDDLTLLENLE
jgi:hypothetical protein